MALEREKIEKGCCSMSAKKMIKDRHGMATIEMSIIIPMIFIIVLAVFYAVFYELDRGIAQSIVSECVIGTSDIVKNNGDYATGRYEVENLTDRELLYMMKTSYPAIKAEVKNDMEGQLKKRLLVSNVAADSFDVKNKKTKGKVTIQMSTPISYMWQVLGRKMRWSYDIEIQNIQGAEQIRRWSTIEQLK